MSLADCELFGRTISPEADLAGNVPALLLLLTDDGREPCGAASPILLFTEGGLELCNGGVVPLTLFTEEGLES